MNAKKATLALAVALATAGGAQEASAYPIHPGKVPVDIAQHPAAKQFTLAYDTDNANIVYYAPKTGRTAALNGQPLVGFAMLPNGEAFLNMQLEFGVFGAEKEALFGAIRAAGKTPVQFPFRRTTLVPLTPGLNPENGKPFCVEVEDPSTGQMVKECDPTLFEELEYSRQGPSLGENIAFTALLNKKGGIIMETLLAQGAAFQANVEAEYYAAGTAFEATVRVSYDKLFENFHAYAAFHDGFCTDIQMEAFWKNEGLCLDRRPEDCGVTVTFTDLSTGKVTTTATIDPDNAEEQQKIFQAVQRLVDDLQKDMLTPMSKALNPLDTSKPDRGFKLNAQYERQKKGMNATFTFKSPRGVNVEKTVFPVALGCVVLDKKNGSINRSLVSDCATYWAN